MVGLASYPGSRWAWVRGYGRSFTDFCVHRCEIKSRSGYVNPAPCSGAKLGCWHGGGIFSWKSSFLTGTPSSEVQITFMHKFSWQTCGREDSLSGSSLVQWAVVGGGIRGVVPQRLHVHHREGLWGSEEPQSSTVCWATFNSCTIMYIWILPLLELNLDGWQ